MKKIYIDAGHGTSGYMSDMGAAAFGRNEADDVMSLSYFLKEFLDFNGFETKLSRDGLTDKGISQRTREANNWGADFYISIHRNAGGGTGHENWILKALQGKNSNNEKQAKELLNAICNTDKLSNRGVKFGTPNGGDFGVNKNTSMNACLLEIGFIDNQKDNEAFDKYSIQYAIALTKVFCRLAGKEFKDPLAINEPEDKSITSQDVLSGYTAKDAREALRISAKLEPLTAKALRMYDLDNDGKITAKDARTILRIAAKLQ